jgi:hypothetical protein
MPLSMKEYARVGAQARVLEIQTELAVIYKAFPGLRAGRRAPNGVSATRVAVPRRRRPAMSAAQRKAVGIRMKKYWAERRAAKK